MIEKILIRIIEIYFFFNNLNKFLKFFKNLIIVQDFYFFNLYLLKLII
jgi:hypothetical protein